MRFSVFFVVAADIARITVRGHQMVERRGCIRVDAAFLRVLPTRTFVGPWRV